jgi:hypothetical protein
MRGVRGRSAGGQSWAAFLTNYAERMWACDFSQTHDTLFREVYVHLASRRMVCVAAARHPTRHGRRSSCAAYKLGRGAPCRQRLPKAVKSVNGRQLVADRPVVRRTGATDTPACGARPGCTACHIVVLVPLLVSPARATPRP